MGSDFWTRRYLHVFLSEVCAGYSWRQQQQLVIKAGWQRETEQNSPVWIFYRGSTQLCYSSTTDQYSESERAKTEEQMEEKRKHQKWGFLLCMNFFFRISGYGFILFFPPFFFIHPCPDSQFAAFDLPRDSERMSFLHKNFAQKKQATSSAMGKIDVFIV